MLDANRGGVKTRAYATKTVFRRNLESQTEIKDTTKGKDTSHRSS